jgi:hypothetical protein
LRLFAPLSNKVNLFPSNPYSTPVLRNLADLVNLHKPIFGSLLPSTPCHALASFGLRSRTCGSTPQEMKEIYDYRGCNVGLHLLKLSSKAKQISKSVLFLIRAKRNISTPSVFIFNPPGSLVTLFSSPNEAERFSSQRLRSLIHPQVQNNQLQLTPNRNVVPLFAG